jgi:hypothetical protein
VNEKDARFETPDAAAAGRLNVFWSAKTAVRLLTRHRDGTGKLDVNEKNARRDRHDLLLM